MMPEASNKSNKAEIYYHDIGSCFSAKFAPVVLKPNVYGDWINQRSGAFSSFIIIGDKKNKKLNEKYFDDAYSSGVVTARDAWCYNFSKNKLAQNIRKTIEFYNKEREE